MHNRFILIFDEELVKLKKGMTEKEIELVIGKPFQIELGSNPGNKKLIYKTSQGTYLILLTNDEMIYATKLN